MKYGKISIIMGAYNCEKYLSQSIESILNQTYGNWEFIICDDGSTDNTYKILQEFEENYKDKFIILKNDQNMGLNYTLNKCLEKATGEYIARQDADDISLPTRFEKEVKCLEEKKVELVSCNMSYFDEFGIWGESHMKAEPVKEDFAKGSPFCHAPSIMRKDAIYSVGGYTIAKRLIRVEDYHLWFKMYQKGYRGYNLKEALYQMRDDKDASKRRNIRNRINEAYVRFIGFRMLKLKPRYYIYVLRPLILLLIPRVLYDHMHRQKLSG